MASIEQEFLGFLYQKDREKKRAFSGGLTQGELGMIEAIAWKTQEAGSSISVKELAVLTECSTPAVSRMLGELEKRGLIERVIDPKDRRGIRVTVTEKGQEVRKREEERLWRIFCDAVAVVGEDRLREMISIWKEMVSAMKQAEEKNNTNTENEKEGQQ